MNYIIEICVAIDIAILGIAYPILIDKISDIGQKYNSEYLANVFESEFPDRRIKWNLSQLQYILIITLLTFLFQIFSIPPIKYFENNLIIANSADILLLLLTTCLTGTFIYWTNKVIFYQVKPSKLLNSLIEKYNSQQDDDQLKTYTLKTINEFAIYAIEKQDSHLEEPLSDFYHTQFQKYRQMSEDYPFDLFSVTNDIIRASIDLPNNKLKYLVKSATSGEFFIGHSYQFSKISPRTYDYLWQNIVLSSSHHELIKSYWASAYRHIEYSLIRVSPEFDGIKITNQVIIDEVDNEREKFFEFNIALGGLLYYLNNYETIKYIFKYTNSLPPNYPLLPQTMDEIFKLFEHFSNPFRAFERPIDRMYYFPEIDNLGTSNLVSHNICMYISLLFVRQFTLNKIYQFQEFKNFHDLKNDLKTLYSYNNMVNYFKNCINKILENSDLLNNLNFKIDNNEVLEVFDKLSHDIEDAIGITKLNAPLSLEKIKQFEDTTISILSNALNEYKVIENSKNFKNVDEKLITYINGVLTSSPKSSYTDNDIPMIYFDSVYANYIVNNKINYFLPNSFLMARTEKYLLEKDNLLDGLEKIIGDAKHVKIVCIRVSYDVLQTLESSKFKTKIIKIDSNNNVLRDTFFILKKRDLPKFEFKEPSENDIIKFKLSKIQNDYNIYANVIDLNLPENLNLKEKYVQNEEESELKVIVIISLLMLIKWRIDRNIIMLSLTSPYVDRGIAHKVEDIKPLK